MCRAQHLSLPDKFLSRDEGLPTSAIKGQLFEVWSLAQHDPGAS